MQTLKVRTMILSAKLLQVHQREMNGKSLSKQRQINGFTHTGSVINLVSKCNANALYYIAFLIDVKRLIEDKHYVGTFPEY